MGISGKECLAGEQGRCHGNFTGLLQTWAAGDLRGPAREIPTPPSDHIPLRRRCCVLGSGADTSCAQNSARMQSDQRARNVLFFAQSPMKHYVGLDVGLKDTNLCIADSEGVTVREVKVSTEAEAIRCALESFADRLDRGCQSVVAGHLVVPRTTASRGPHHCC
jgi:hypothetical protein